MRPCIHPLQSRANCRTQRPEFGASFHRADNAFAASETARFSAPVADSLFQEGLRAIGVLRWDTLPVSPAVPTSRTAFSKERCKSLRTTCFISKALPIIGSHGLSCKRTSESLRTTRGKWMPRLKSCPITPGYAAAFTSGTTQFLSARKAYRASSSTWSSSM